MTSSPGKHAAPHRGRRIVLIVLAVILALLIALGGGVLLMIEHGRSALHDPEKDLSVPTSLVDDADGDGIHVTYNGEKYIYNENTVGLLVLGVDKESINKNEGYGANGQADSIFLAVLDTVTGKVRILQISREAMTDVRTYTADGNYAGTQKKQICLAYAYGKDGKESCQNTADAVSRMLYGMPINGFAAIDLAGLTALTDAVGGITLDALETLDIGGRKICTKGQKVTLDGYDATRYIRERGDDVNANNRRMDRQKQFLKALVGRIGELLKKNPTRITGYYRTLKPYLVTDLDLTEITYLSSVWVESGGGEVEYLSLPGETVMGEKYVEFYPDQTALYENILAMFYTKVETGTEVTQSDSETPQ